MKILRRIVIELSEYVFCILIWMPGVLGVRIRECFYRRLLGRCGIRFTTSQGCMMKGFKHIRIGDNVNIGPYVQIYAEETDKLVEIGDRGSFNSNVMINANFGGSIKIGNDVLIGPNVVLRTSNHIFSNKNISISKQGYKPGSIMIGDDVWLGANAVVLPEVVIGKGAVVGAGAVVTKNVEEYTIVAGVPARKIGIREAVS